MTSDIDHFTVEWELDRSLHTYLDEIVPYLIEARLFGHHTEQCVYDTERSSRDIDPTVCLYFMVHGYTVINVRTDNEQAIE